MNYLNVILTLKLFCIYKKKLFNNRKKKTVKMEKKLKLLKYITKKKFSKLNRFIINNLNHLSELSDEFECFIFDSNFKTTLLYYLFSIDEYDLACMILSNGFNVYKGCLYYIRVVDGIIK